MQYCKDLFLSTNIDDPRLPSRFSKLIKRLRSASMSSKKINMGETIEDVANLSIEEVAALPGVGRTYLETLEELKLLVTKLDKCRFSDELSVKQDSLNFSSLNLDGLRLRLGNVDAKYTKALYKYSRYIDADDLTEHLDKIIKLDESCLFEVKGFGAKMVGSLVEFKSLVNKELELILKGKIDLKNFESGLIVPKHVSKMSIERVEEILLEDIDNYFDMISQKNVDIIQKRWGFVDDKKTLEEIASEFDLTRERIRQKEVKINKEFLHYVRIDQVSLWEIIEPELTPDIVFKMEYLYSCFSSGEDFFEFLNLVCGQKRLVEYVYPEVDKNILNTVFIEDGAPIHIDDAREYIANLNIKEDLNIDNVIKNLAKKEVLYIEKEQIWPKQLSKAEASACVLVKHEKGLPWFDVAKLVNSNGFSKTNIYEDRLDNEAADADSECNTLIGWLMGFHGTWPSARSSLLSDI